MLNTKALSELLTKNVHSKLCPSLFAMSPEGTLIAYSIPANIKQVRDQAALISMTLNDSALESREGKGPIQAFTVHVDARNIIARRVRHDLFIVLVGDLPPNDSKSFDVNVERLDSPRYPSPLSIAGDELGEIVRETQDLQRARLDALCGFVASRIDVGEGSAQ